MNEIWVVEVFTRNMRPSVFDITPQWIIAKICESKRLADAWREDNEEWAQANQDSGYKYSAHDSQYRTIRYVAEGATA